MRVSRLMLVTLRDDPAEAEIPSHKLLLRAGYIRRVASGIYAYLPLLFRVLQKISAIVREELNATGALETLLPQLQPADLWERSGRWSGYTAGEGIMFHLRDRQGRELGLGPTHEEVVTALAADLLRSYRQLPVNLYQIQTKFRDEIRPRFGLMRGREFIMKDGYSFHANEASLQDSYGEMDRAYRRIFSRCGLRTVAVEADSGAIGGSASQEFMVTAEAGEDLILSSGDGLYAANQERAVSLAAAALPLAAQPCRELDTPGQTSIEDLCAAHGFDPSQIVKVLLLVARCADGSLLPVLVSLRGDQLLNAVKLANGVSARLAPEQGTLLSIEPLTADLVRSERLPLDLSAIPFGSLGPDLSDGTLVATAAPTPTQVLAGSGNAALATAAQLRLVPKLLRLTDPTAAELETFVCGGNNPDKHRVGATWAGLGLAPELVDLRAAQSGDRCLHDPEQTLTAARGIEVGHIFQLGRKYSEALGARFTNESGAEEALWMGCYGIGVSRLAQAAVEQNHDSNGICWPVAIAPFEVIVVIANLQEPAQHLLGEELYTSLLAAGLDALLDDRDERAGVKFKDADLLGIPWRVVVGRGAKEGQVELVQRQGSVKRELAAAELIAELSALIKAGRSGLLA
ncbi:MAG: proline--tRNA ligase [Cyanobacteria bacterium]|nr:proline--tRNA ligase [Cyanobacteriota bacterium]